MTSRQLIDDATRRLENIGDMDAGADAEWLMCACLGCGRSFLCNDVALSARQAQRYEAMLSRREAGEPLQYVLGDQPFMGHMFNTDARALIPRSETEEVCLKALELVRHKRKPAVLDVGTGTGALSVSVKLERPDARVCAVDISAQALSLARENAQKLGAAVDFFEGDLYEPVAGQRFDLIVSNPPYIKSSDMAKLQSEVKREPALALDGGADGLDFYRRLTRGARDMLAPEGCIVFEVGEGQAQDVAKLLGTQGFVNVEVQRDINGIERIVSARVE